EPSDAQVLIVHAVHDLVRRKVKRGPELEIRARVLVIGRHHSDHLEWLTVELDLPAHDRSIGCEPATPKCVAQNRDARIAELFLFSERPPQQRLDAEN